MHRVTGTRIKTQYERHMITEQDYRCSITGKYLQAQDYRHKITGTILQIQDNRDTIKGTEIQAQGFVQNRLTYIFLRPLRAFLKAIQLYNV